MQKIGACYYSDIKVGTDHVVNEMFAETRKCQNKILKIREDVYISGRQRILEKVKLEQLVANVATRGSPMPVCVAEGVSEAIEHLEKICQELSDISDSTSK